MAINVRCPNAACGKMLSVRDDFGGKTGKCPSCGSTLQIPLAQGEEVEFVTPDAPAPRPRYEDEPEEVRPRRGRREEEYEDDDDYDDRRRGRCHTASGRRAGGSMVGTLVCSGIGFGLLVFLIFIPLFSMYQLKLPKRQGLPQVEAKIGGMIKLTEGKILMIVTIVVAVIVLASTILYLTIPENISKVFLTVTGCIAAGWGLVVLLWVFGFVWDIINLSSYTKNMIQKMGGEIGGGSGEFSLTPGIGLWIGIVLAIGVMAVFSTLISIWGKGIWLSLSEGVGLLVGVLLLTLNVQPWYGGPPTIEELRKDPNKGKEHYRYEKLVEKNFK